MVFVSRLVELTKVLENCSVTTGRGAVSLDEGLHLVHFLMLQMLKVNGRIFSIGNGGSESIAAHFSTDLLRTLKIPSFSLAEASTLTCFANDFGYENVYSEWLEKIFQAEDVLFAISSSGRSSNVVQAAKVVQKKRGILITLTGFSHENPLRKLGDVNFWINSQDYGLVEVGHMFLLHTIIDTWNLCSKKSKALTKSDTS